MNDPFRVGLLASRWVVLFRRAAIWHRLDNLQTKLSFACVIDVTRVDSAKNPRTVSTRKRGCYEQCFHDNLGMNVERFPPQGYLTRCSEK